MDAKMYNELLDRLFKTADLDTLNDKVNNYKRSLIVELVNNSDIDDHKIDKDLFIDEFILPCLI